MKTNDYIKFLTQEFVTYVDQPKDQRKKKKQSRNKQEKPIYTSRWFGLIPFALLLAFKKKR
ncbi:MAG: YqzE family protein [Bacillus sp. (in: firmicutes)]